MPVKKQAQRGVCWDFATMAVAEYTYRINGIQNLFLKEEECVFFSEQAGVIGIVRDARQNPQWFSGTHRPEGVTDDGYTPWLYWLNRQASTGGRMAVPILPNAVCPYQTVDDPGLILQCDVYDSALSQNPLAIRNISLRMLYIINDIKRVIAFDAHVVTFEIELTT